MSERVETVIDGRTLSLSNLDKVLYPETGFTKGQVIEYYGKVAPTMLPHLEGRPITLKRYPNGVDGLSFFEKNCPSHRPDWIPTIEMATEANGGVTRFCELAEPAALVFTANLAALELHPQLQRTPNLDTPTTIVFDLDPGAPATVIECARVALRLRDMFAEFDLKCFAKTSGSKGMQLYVPLNFTVTFAETAGFAKAIGQLLEKQTPDEVLVNMTKSMRPGKVFIDWSQNNRIKTTVAVYSLRARPRHSVSTPLIWDEVSDLAAASDPDQGVYLAEDVLARIDKHGDLFAPLLTLQQSLPKLG